MDDKTSFPQDGNNRIGDADAVVLSEADKQPLSDQELSEDKPEGVARVSRVEMDKLVTYFDRFDADITNAVDVEVYDEKVPG